MAIVARRERCDGSIGRGHLGPGLTRTRGGLGKLTEILFACVHLPSVRTGKC
jgi:hypothetical protein